MEMSLKRSTLLVLTAVASVVISDQNLVILDGKQRSWNVPVGSSVTLHCKLPTDNYDRFRLCWRFNPSGPSFNESEIILKAMYGKTSNTTTEVSNKKQDLNTDKDAVMKHTLSDFKEENKGWYFCSITAEIPFMMHKHSEATEISISTVSPIDHQPLEWWMWITLGVSAFILIVLLVVCAVLRRRQRTSREDPVYANTRSVVSKQPSPRPGGPAGNLKAISSSETLRNPSPGQRYGEGNRRHRP